MVDKVATITATMNSNEQRGATCVEKSAILLLPTLWRGDFALFGLWIMKERR